MNSKRKSKTITLTEIDSAYIFTSLTTVIGLLKSTAQAFPDKKYKANAQKRIKEYQKVLDKFFPEK